MCGPHVAAPVSAADNGTSPAVSSASAADGQERERKPLWLHYLNGQRHFLKVSNMQRSDNRACRRCTVCVCVDSVRCVAWREGMGRWGWVGGREGGTLRRGKSLSRRQDLNYTVRTKTVCENSQDSGALLHWKPSSSPGHLPHLQHCRTKTLRQGERKRKKTHTGTYQLFCDRINACLLKVIECV